MLSQQLSHFPQMDSMGGLILGKYQDIVNKNYDELVQILLENSVHKVHEISWSIAQTKRHDRKLVRTIACTERRHRNACIFHSHLMVA